MKRNLRRFQVLLDAAGDSRRPAVEIVLVALTIPPDLCFLEDGLARTRQWLSIWGGELDQLLGSGRSNLPGAAALQDAIQLVLEIVGAPGFCSGEDDPIHWPVGRRKETDPHPLRGYCYSVCHFWCTLFFALEDGADARLAEEYRSLSARFAMHVIAANLQVSPKDWLAFCQNWRNVVAQRSSGLRMGRLASRVSAASRAIDRLSGIEWRRALVVLSERGLDLSLGGMLRSASEDPLFAKPDDEAEINDFHTLIYHLQLLLDETEQGWRQGAATPRAKVRGRKVTTRRPRLPSGHVHIVGTDVLRDVQEFEDGTTLKIDLHPMNPPSGPTSNPAPDDLESAEQGPPIDVTSVRSIATAVIDLAGKSAGSSLRPLGAVVAAAMRKHLAVPSAGFTSPTHLQLDRLKHALAQDAVTNTLGIDDPCVRAMMATGRDPRAGQLSVFPNAEQGIAAGDSGEPFFALAENHWVLPIQAPAFADRPIDPAERTYSPWLRVPDLLGFGASVRRSTDEAQRARPFPLRVARQFDRRVTTWARAIAQDERVTVGSLRNFLFGRLMKITRGDVALALDVTAHAVAHGRTAIHYAAYDQAAVRRCYIEAMAPIACSGPTADDVVADNTPSDEINHVGARCVPSHAAVRALVHALACRIGEVHGSKQRRLHALYTMVGVQLGLGARPLIRRVLYEGSERTRLVLLTEKSSSPYHHRLLAIPQVLQVQLREHEQVLRACMPGWKPEDGLFFDLIDPPREVQELGPAEFRDVASRLDYGLELYSLRRFMRTELIARGALPEDVDAFMGHWFERLSPHDPLSTYPMRRLVELADGPISDILRDVGYVPLRIAP
jgi:hypothetical protein